MSQISESVGCLIKRRRMELGFTQLQVADAVGATDAYISGLENDRKIPSYPMVKAIARCLNCEVEELYRTVEAQRAERDLKKAARRLESYSVDFSVDHQDSPEEQAIDQDFDKAVGYLRQIFKNHNDREMILKILERFVRL